MKCLWKKKWKVAKIKQKNEEQNLANTGLYFIVKPKCRNFRSSQSVYDSVLPFRSNIWSTSNTGYTGDIVIWNKKWKILDWNITKKIKPLGKGWQLCCYVIGLTLSQGSDSWTPEHSQKYSCFFFYWLGSKVHWISEEGWGIEAGTAE